MKNSVLWKHDVNQQLFSLSISNLILLTLHRKRKNFLAIPPPLSISVSMSLTFSNYSKMYSCNTWLIFCKQCSSLFFFFLIVQAYFRKCVRFCNQDEDLLSSEVTVSVSMVCKIQN